MSEHNDRLEAIRKARAEWQQRHVEGARLRKKEFKNGSGYDSRELYCPTDSASRDFQKEVSLPGEYPYRRGVHATMYRSRLWTMRLFAGFATPSETNERFRKLLSEGSQSLFFTP